MREAPAVLQDDAHAGGHLQLLGELLQPLAVGRVGDLARDAAAARRVGHQHRVAAGERQVGGERRALVAALFLDDLHEQDLAALDDLLNLVLAAQRAVPPLGHFLEGVGAPDLLDDRLDLFRIAVVSLAVGCTSLALAIEGRYAPVLAGRFGGHVVLIVVLGPGLDLASLMLLRLGPRLTCRSFAVRRTSCCLAVVEGLVDVVVHALAVVIADLDVALGTVVIGRGHLGRLRAGLVLAAARFISGLRSGVGNLARRDLPGIALDRFVAATPTGLLAVGATTGGAVLVALGVPLCPRFFFKERLPIGDRNLIVVRMNFAEGKEAVAIAAIFDERGLQ